jgi:type 2 lantibiotic biosynthesis protein LanM
LALDLHFQELLAWLNERGDHPPFRTLRVVDRGEHGWVEFVVARSCDSREELVRFYRRQGGYLSLLYALDATDFHTENLIAEGEHPVLLDLEALFHAHPGTADETGPMERLARDAIDNSVLRIGLLPHRIWANADSDGVDLSGLGSAEGQTSPHPIAQWQGAGTDEMRLGREHMILPVGNSRPALQGAEVDILDYEEDITTGFTAMYRLLQKHRGELLAAGGPLARFASDEVRAILRATQTYGAILRESYHPDVLRDALDRDRLFDQLWTQVEHTPHLARAMPFELADFQQGDIPMFSSRPHSRDLWSSSGERIPGFFAESSLTHVKQRLERLDDKDLEQQLWFVRASLATVSRHLRGAQPYPAARVTKKTGRFQLVTAARAVGDRLEEMALQDGGAVTWIGLTQSNERHWMVIPAGMDLYDGLPGIGLFLAHLAAITQEERYHALAQKAANTLRELTRRHRAAITSVGAFDGWGGVIYSLTHLSALWNEPALLEEARATVELLPPLIERDEHLDIIAGTAGCLGSLLSLHRHAPAGRILAVARQCGERLLARAKAMPQGVAWLIPIAKDRALSGFAHGVAGIAWSLLELAELTGEDRFRTLAADAITYERSLFSAEQQNWLDIRTYGEKPSLSADDNTPPICANAWCHGAPGIGLARLSALQHHDDARIREEIGIALATIWEGGFGQNHCLCHGDLGNLDILSMAGTTLNDAKLRDRAEEMTTKMLERISAEGWQCGNPLLVESPGLMTGLAGIGYGLLRLAEPEAVPSVLILAPPAVRKLALT